MKSFSQLPRMPSKLPDPLRQRLNMYALAASAAGVSVLALTPTAEAKIIYTKVHQVIGPNGIYPLDLNHDGIIDFLIEESSSGRARLAAQAAMGNAVETNKYAAVALKKGAPIGPHQLLWGSNSWVGQYMAWQACTTYGSCYMAGPWLNAKSRYLGLGFQIEGKTHYGWARLSVQAQGYQITATLTGYAYETVANKGIRAGQTSGPEGFAADGAGPTASTATDPTQAVRPASNGSPPPALGYLALGNKGLSFWRRQ